MFQPNDLLNENFLKKLGLNHLQVQWNVSKTEHPWDKNKIDLISELSLFQRKNSM